MSVLISVLLLLQQAADPLPDLQSFLRNFRQVIQTDEQLLSQYTFTQTERVIHLDSNDRPKKTEVKIFEVFPGVEREDTYRRLISENGVPVSAKELEKQDREQSKREQSRQKRSAADIEKARTEREREERQIMDDIFAMYDVQMLGREFIDGHSTIVLRFHPKAGFKPRTRDGKIAQHVAGRIWVSEQEYQPVRIDAEVIDTISIGFGLLARLHKGTKLFAERRKFNDEVWLPFRVEAKAEARVLLLKGINVHQITEYSDHKRYRVETIITMPEPQ